MFDFFFEHQEISEVDFFGSDQLVETVIAVLSPVGELFPLLHRGSCFEYQIQPVVVKMVMLLGLKLILHYIILCAR